MCGRFFVDHNSINNAALNVFSMSLPNTSSGEVFPGQKIPVIAANHSSKVTGPFVALKAKWGIKPSWASRPIINARVETAAEKPTFKLAYQNNRCVIPMSGWYEWKQQPDEPKRRYTFESSDGSPLWMAGFFYLNAPNPEMVSLTTHPDEICSQFHDRMPLIISTDQIQDWLLGNFETARRTVECIKPIKISVR